jgi:hypothetical protein
LSQVPVEQRWILTHSGPYDLNGMPQVQTCELVSVAVPEPVPQPLGSNETVKALQAKQAEFEREAESAREQADRLGASRGKIFRHRGVS